MTNIRYYIILFNLLTVINVYSQTPTFEQLLSQVSHRDKETDAIISLIRPSATNDTIKNYCLCYSENLGFDIELLDDSTYLVSTGLIGSGAMDGCIPQTICGGTDYKFTKAPLIDEEYKKISKYKINLIEEKKDRINRITTLTSDKLKYFDSYCNVVATLGLECEKADITIFNIEQGSISNGFILKYQDIYLLFYTKRMFKMLYDVRCNFDEFNFNAENASISAWSKVTNNHECVK